MNTKNVPVLRNLCQFIKIIFANACPPWFSEIYNTYMIVNYNHINISCYIDK